MNSTTTLKPTTTTTTSDSTTDLENSILTQLAAGDEKAMDYMFDNYYNCLLYTSPSPRDRQKSRMPSSA